MLRNSSPFLGEMLDFAHIKLILICWKISMKRLRQYHNQDQDDDQDEGQERITDEAFKEKLLGEFVDVGSLLKKLRDKKTIKAFQSGRPTTFIAVLDKLLSLEIQDEKQNAQRYEALKHLAMIKTPQITKPEANYFLYCIGIEYAQRFTHYRELQTAFFKKMAKITKGGDAILATMQGDLNALNNLKSLDYSKDLERKFPPLSLFATANNQPEVLRFLHKRGKVVRPIYRVFDPLFHAAAHGLDDMVQALFECIDATEREPVKYYKHCPSKFIDEMQYSIPHENGCWEDARGYLSVAAEYGQLMTVKLLQRMGCKDHEMDSCLSAADSGHFQVVEHLLSEFLSEQSNLQLSALISERLVTILERLVANKQEDLVQRLLKLFRVPEKSRVNEVADLVHTALKQDHLDVFVWTEPLTAPPRLPLYNILEEAIINRSLKILTYLFEKISKDDHSATIYYVLRNHFIQDDGYHFYHRRNSSPTDAQLPNFKKSLQHLAQLGVDFRFQDPQGCNLQMLFTQRKRPDVVELLNELGVDPSVKNKNNQSAYDLCGSIDTAVALLKFKPSEEAKGVARISPFSLKRIRDFYRTASNSYFFTFGKDTKKFMSDVENILEILLQIIEDQFALIEKGDSNLLNAAWVFTQECSVFIASLQEDPEVAKRLGKIKNPFLLLRLQMHLKILESYIANFKMLSENPEVDEEKKTAAMKRVRAIFAAGTGIDPLLFGEQLKKLFQQYLESKDLESYEILLACILSFDASNSKFILCRAIGELLHGFKDSKNAFPLKNYHAYICFNEAGKNNADVASLATMTLSELMEITVDCQVTPDELNAKNPKKYAEVIAKVGEENAKFTHLDAAISNAELLTYAAGQGNLETVKDLFEQGQFNFENIGKAFFTAKKAAVDKKHYDIVAYLVLNAVFALLKRKLYQKNDFNILKDLSDYLKRPFIPTTLLADEALAQMQKSVFQKNELNSLIRDINFSFTREALRGLSQRPDSITTLLKNISILENYILNNYDASLFQESLSDDFLAVLNSVLVMAHHDNQGDRSLQNIINFLVERLSNKRIHLPLAIVLNEYTHDKALKATKRTYLFNDLSESTYSSLDEFKQTSPLKLLTINLLIRAAWCDLFGRKEKNPENILALLDCDNSSQFWESYKIIKNEMDQFLDSYSRPCHQYELFSSLESECMLVFIKTQEQLLEERKKSAETGSPRLFSPIKRSPSTDPIPPDDQKQAKYKA